MSVFLFLSIQLTEKIKKFSSGGCKNGMNFHYDDCGVEINCLGVGDFKDLSVIDDTKQLPTVSLNEIYNI